MVLRYLLPLGVFAAVAVALGVSLTMDPRIIPSALKGKTVPEFALAAVQGRHLGLSSDNLRESAVTVVNVFASWCGPCRIEHPLIMKLRDSGITVHGINYKDRPENAAEWLDTFGDPYLRTGADLDGRVSIDWGVYGVPETYVIDGHGLIIEKHVGPLMPDDINEKILPAIARAKR